MKKKQFSGVFNIFLLQNSSARNIEERLFENTYYIVALAELVHNKFAHCHEFLLKISPTSNDAFVSPCSHVHDRSVDHLRVLHNCFEGTNMFKNA